MCKYFTPNAASEIFHESMQQGKPHAACMLSCALKRTVRTS